MDTGLLLGEDTVESPAFFRVGIARGAELLFGATPIVIRNSGDPDERSGIGDLVAGAKLWFLDQGPRLPAFALETMVKLPTGEDAVSSGKTDIALTGIATRSYRYLLADVNIGFDLIGRGGDGASFDEVWRCAASGIWKTGTPLSYVTEIAGRFVPESDVDEVVIGFGFLYGVDDTFLLDGGTRIGISEDAPEVQITFGVTKLVGKLGR
jgi:hypothetical protein